MTGAQKFRTILGTALVSGMLATSLASCDALSGRETTGEYVDDATITTKVKAAIIKDDQLKLSQINVNTLQDVVQLSGFVDSAAVKARAGEVARSVKGVRSVKNDLVVR